MKYAVIGTGLMGLPIAEVLLDKDYDVIVYNRTESKTESLINKGAKKAGSAMNAIKYADIIILMLSDAHAIKECLFSETSSFRGKTFLQMGTIGSAQSQDFDNRISNLEGEYLEAPVLGSINEVKNGSLIIMAGGSKAIFDKHLPFFKIFSAEPLYIGKVGTAATMKLALNQLIASLTAAFSLSLGMIRETGINVNRFMEILRKSSLYAPQFDKKLNKMLHRDFQWANFPVEHLLKDVNLCIEEADNKGLETSQISGMIPILEKAMEMGLMHHDYSALYNAIHREK